MMTSERKFEFDQVAFFGRSIEEYVDMFDLNLGELRGKKVLDVSSGPAAFAGQAAKLGIEVVAVDPMYGSPLEKLRQIVDRDTDAVKLKSDSNRHLLHPQVVAPAQRRKAMELFLSDFAESKESHRYVEASLPDLPFLDLSFDMVLNANFLFLYSDIASGGMSSTSRFDYEFHRQAIEELIRVSRHEVRIHPLRAPGAGEHAYLRELMAKLDDEGFEVLLQPVSQRDIIGAEEMLRIIRHQ